MMRFPPPLVERIERHKRISGECWEWDGEKTKDGYGVISVNCKTVRVHRLSWAMANNTAMPREMVLHKCDNRSCFNPDHLYTGNHKQNAFDATSRGRLFAQRITHCPNGHEYTKESTRIYMGKRYCRTCDALRKRVPEKQKLKQGRPPVWKK